VTAFDPLQMPLSGIERNADRVIEMRDGTVVG